MHAHLAKVFTALRSSYWFVPSIMALAAVLLSVATTIVDLRQSALPGEGLGFFPIQADGARDVLATIAGSMITVAGVSFSITIAAVAYATTQLGPRLLGNFLRDTGNQIVLGTFIATFLYCILVLRTVQAAGADGAPFIPQWGVLTAVALSVCSLAVLIFFFHHVPASIQVSRVVAELGHELNAQLERIFPSTLGRDPPAEEAEQLRDRNWVTWEEPIRAGRTGYVQHLDVESLFSLACRHDLVVCLLRRPGDFVHQGEALASVSGPNPGDAHVLKAVATALVVGRERTPAQDVMFIVQHLVEIGARAVSPGLNDPFTTTACLNWLGSALENLGRRDIPSRFRHDHRGRLRVVAPTITFAEMAEEMFDPLRPYIAADRTAGLHGMQVLAKVARALPAGPRREVLLAQAKALVVACDAVAAPQDAETVRRAYREMVAGSD